MRLGLPSLPSLPAVPMPRRITLRWKLAGLLIFIGVLLVTLTMVSLASLAKVSDGGRRNFTHVTQSLAALGSARALINENAALADRHILEDSAETKRPLEQRILANDRRIERALAQAAPTFTNAQLDLYGLAAAMAAAALCFGIRMIGVHFDLNAPTPRAAPDPGQELD